MAHKALILTAILLIGFSLIYPGSPSGQVTDFLPDDNLNSAGLYALINDTSLNPEAFRIGYMGYQTLVATGSARKENVITIIDFSRPSSEERLYVIDPAIHSVIYKTLVAHGRNSGDLYAQSFSNRPQSHQSALGFYITDSPYLGGQGYSLLINGVDTGFNDNARKRSIVIHGADYVSNQYIKRYGRLGRSFGCPALPEEVNAPIIDLIKDGSVVFCYYPDDHYIRNSKVVGNAIRETLSALWF
jgi:hypothetical protein